MYVSSKAGLLHGEVVLDGASERGRFDRKTTQWPYRPEYKYSELVTMTRVNELLGYLPTGAHEPDEGYTGFLSYSVEVHAAMIGIASGAVAATTGDIQLLLTLVDVALLAGRGQQVFTEKVTSQITKEPWYALGFAFATYLLLNYDISTVVNGVI